MHAQMSFTHSLTSRSFTAEAVHWLPSRRLDITNAYAGMEMIHPMHCLPDGANLGQLQKVAIKGLNEMPEKLHEGAAGLALIVLIKAFPCD